MIWYYDFLVNCLKETEISELKKKLEEQSNNLKLQFDEELNRHKQESEEEKMKLILSHDKQVIELQETNKLEISQMQKSATDKQIELTQRILILEHECDLLKSETDLLKEENQRLIEDKKLHVIIMFLLVFTKLLIMCEFFFFSRIQILVTKSFVMKQNH